MQDTRKYIIVETSIIPDVYVKVLEAKKILNDDPDIGVTEATKMVGISRSTYYKYSEHVFALSDGIAGKKVTITLLLSHESGVLSNFLKLMAEKNANILTISQDTPINGKANVSITFDISEINVAFDELMDSLKAAKGVNHLELIGME